MSDVMLPVVAGVAATGFVAGTWWLVHEWVEDEIGRIRSRRRGRPSRRSGARRATSGRAPRGLPLEARPARRPGEDGGRARGGGRVTGAGRTASPLARHARLLLVAGALATISLLVSGPGSPRTRPIESTPPASGPDWPGPARSAAVAGRTATPAAAAPALVRSALEAVVGVQAALQAERAALAAILAVPDPDVAAIAASLRAITTTAGRGAELVAVLATWETARPLSSDLTTFYGAVRATARDGLDAPVADQEAYRRAGAAMLEALAALPAIDERARAVRAAAGAGAPVLPPVPATPLP